MHVALITEEFQDRSTSRSAPPTRLAAEVCRGVRASEFHVVYQSIVDSTTGKTCGAEALLRWQHPEYGLLLPGCFAQALADQAVAEEISYFVLERVCQDLGASSRSSKDNAYVTINVAPSMLFDTALPGKIQALCERYRIAPSTLMLELLESEGPSIPFRLNEFAAPLRKLGVRLALDDFGTGFSSLARLDGLHVDVVKIARELILNVPDSARSSLLTGGVMDLLRRLGIDIIVEGVETAEQLSWIQQFPGVQMQGFYFRRPVNGLELALQDVPPEPVAPTAP
jgi:EAL domain-containing protein (putative c-di-GMP-specific phosphodiesterase class I)